MFRQARAVVAATVAGVTAGILSFGVHAADIDAETLYNQYCAVCHADPDDGRTPSRQALLGFNANSIHQSLTQGIMQPQAAALTDEQIIVLSEYLSNSTYNPMLTASVAVCDSEMPAFDLDQANNWNAWGNSLGNSRFQGAEGTNINAGNIDRLELVWAFGLEGANVSRAQPTVISDTMILGSPSGTVYAMDIHSGCAYWTYSAIAEVRGSIPVGYSESQDRFLAVVADATNRIQVLDARTGERLWWDDVDDNRYARSTGSPVIHEDRVFVPVSSTEVSAAGRPDHHCCTFRGNVAAYDINTGEKLWHTYVMDEAKKVGENAIGNPVYAPSGAPIWQAPSVDPARNIVYAGTGQNYSRPTTETSNAVIAFDMDSGDMRWVFQTESDDAFTMACVAGRDHPNCPDAGPDVDIGAPILPVTLSDGRDMVVTGTKGAVIFGLDPDNEGEVLWKTRIGQGSPLGGVHWGMTHIGDTLFVPNADRTAGQVDFPQQPGLHAIDMKTGEILWYTPSPERCAEGQQGCFDSYSAPATATADMVLAGSLSGVLFAHDPKTGEVIWEYDTRKSYDTVNGVEANGGSLDSTGPVLTGDYMIVNAGYATFGQIPGNVMLVFRLRD